MPASNPGSNPHCNGYRQLIDFSSTELGFLPDCCKRAVSMFPIPQLGIHTLSAAPKCLRRCFSGLSIGVPVFEVVPSSCSGAAKGRHEKVTWAHCNYLALDRRGLAFATAAGGQTLREGAEKEMLDSAAQLSLGGAAQASSASDIDALVQYVVIRKDLVETLSWPLGSIISQGCHAAVAAIWLHKEDAQTLQYCAAENLDGMHTVTLEVKGDTQLLNLSKKLEGAGIAHKLWIEQPENIPTCLATKPYPKSQVGQFFKKLKLCK